MSSLFMFIHWNILSMRLPVHEHSGIVQAVDSFTVAGAVPGL